MEGTYHPALSMYTLPQQTQGATATFNFGAPAALRCMLGKLHAWPPGVVGQRRSQAGMRELWEHG